MHTVASDPEWIIQQFSFCGGTYFHFSKALQFLGIGEVLLPPTFLVSFIANRCLLFDFQ